MTFRIVASSDSSLSVRFDDRIDETINAQVVLVAEAIEKAGIKGVRDVVPAFRSVTIYFDPLEVDLQALTVRLNAEASSSRRTDAEAAFRVVRIPVCYGGSFGPDLDDVAAFGRMEPSEVIALHSTPLYRVFMLGFVPGFAYLASVDARIAAPRRATPRTRIDAGSVGIAGVQTGVYPSDTPGGWQIIGRTPVRPVDWNRSDPFLFKPGDRVQFYPIAAADYDSARDALASTSA